MFGMTFDRRGLTLAAITLISAVTLMALCIGVITLINAIALIALCIGVITLINAITLMTLRIGFITLINAITLMALRISVITLINAITLMALRISDFFSFSPVRHCHLREIRVALPGCSTAAAREALPVPTSVGRIYLCPNKGKAASIWDL